MISGQQSKNQPSISVIGAGALGCNIFLQLQHLANIRLVGRQSGQRCVQNQRLPVASWQQVHSIEHAIICCKVTELDSVASQLASRLTHNSVVISLCNGMGFDDHLVSLPGHYLPGVTTAAAWRQQDDVNIVSQGSTTLGGCAAPQWLHQTDWHWQDDMTQARWAKLVINALINPLTVLANAANGALLESPWAEQQAVLAAELQALVAAKGLDLGPLLPLAQQVCRATAANISSSLQDSRAGRATELPWICGFVLKQATALNLTMPAFKHMCQQLEDKGYATQLV